MAGSTRLPASGAGSDVAIQEEFTTDAPPMDPLVVDMYDITRTGTAIQRRSYGSKFLSRCLKPRSERSILGHGSNGAVYRVEIGPERPADRSTGSLVGDLLRRSRLAVKIVFNYGRSSSKVETHESQKEFDILNRMTSHRNIVRIVFECVERPPQWMVQLLPTPGLVCASEDGDDEGGGAAGGVVNQPRDAQIFGMELLHMSLYDKLQRIEEDSGHLDDRLVVGWGSDIAEGLFHLLRHGVIHRDLKLDNVMWDSQGGPEGVGRAVIIDLGCSLRVAVDRTAAASTAGLGEDEGICRRLDATKFWFLDRGGDGVGGNPAHLAPEVLDAWYRGAILGDDDVVVPFGKQTSWALGVILHELATGEHPHGSDFPAKLSSGTEIESGRIAAALEASTGPWAGDGAFSKRPAWYQDLVRALLEPDPSARMGLGEAVHVLRRGRAYDSSGAEPSKDYWVAHFRFNRCTWVCSACWTEVSLDSTGRYPVLCTNLGCLKHRLTHGLDLAPAGSVAEEDSAHAHG